MRVGGDRVDRAHPAMGTRLFVGAFIVTFTVCGVAGIDGLWPLTGWRLFSALRQPYQIGWRAVIVDNHGDETPFPLGELPLAYRGSPLLINRFEKMAPSQQEELCETLASAARSRHFDASSVRIYQVERDESRREGARAAAEVLTLRYTCGNGSVQAAGP